MIILIAKIILYYPTTSQQIKIVKKRYVVRLNMVSQKMKMKKQVNGENTTVMYLILLLKSIWNYFHSSPMKRLI